MSRITRSGADWLNPYQQPTAWQRERWSTWDKIDAAAFHGPEPWWRAMLAWVTIFAIVAVVLGLVA